MEKKITQTSFSCSRLKTCAGAENMFKVLIDSNNLKAPSHLFGS